LKTLHLTNSWHETSGGIATFYRALIEESNRRKQEIRLVVPGENDRTEEAGRFGKIYHVRAPRALLNSRYRMIYPANFLARGSKLQQILTAERPDLVEICDKYTLPYLGILLRRQLLTALDFRPVVVGLSCERMDDNFRSYLGSLPVASLFCSRYMRWLYFPFFDYHIANSEYTAGELRQAAQGHVVPRGTWVRHMGVDLHSLSPQRRSQAVRRRLLKNCAADDQSVLLLYVGRLVPEKNLALLFNLLQHLAQTNTRDFRLLLVGEGIERSRRERECNAQLPGRAFFLGHIADRSALADLYANCDIFIHPNPREPFGIAPLEAMASGLPVIAPNRGGVISYANSQNAWTVEPDVKSFSAAVEEALANDALRVSKIAAALSTAQAYGWETVAASFLELYEDICAAFKAQRNPTLHPSFYSTSATGFNAVLFHAISQSAEKMFAGISRLVSDSRSGSRLTNVDPMSEEGS
jgi:alpha-1,6-mannosyltransferase